MYIFLLAPLYLSSSSASAPGPVLRKHPKKMKISSFYKESNNVKKVLISMMHNIICMIIYMNHVIYLFKNTNIDIIFYKPIKFKIIELFEK